MPLPGTKREKKNSQVQARPKTTRRRGHLGNHSLWVIVLLVVAVTAPVVVAWYGWSHAAVIDFTFGGTNDVRRSYQLTAMSSYQLSTIDITHVLVRNSGNTDITVIVSLHAMNAVVAPAPGNYYGPYTDTANVQIHLPVSSGYQLVTFYLTLPAQVPSFTIRVSVSRVLDFSGFGSLVTSGFATVQPTSPTTLVYMNTVTSPQDYELSQQS